MKVPVLSLIVLLSLLALQSAQGAALGDSQEGTTVSNYAERSEVSENGDTQFLNVERWRSAFKSKEFLNWPALFEAIKEKLPFLNWEALPKLKGMRSVIPDSQ